MLDAFWLVTDDTGASLLIDRARAGASNRGHDAPHTRLRPGHQRGAATPRRRVSPRWCEAPPPSRDSFHTCTQCRSRSGTTSSGVHYRCTCWSLGLGPCGTRPRRRGGPRRRCGATAPLQHSFNELASASSVGSGRSTTTCTPAQTEYTGDLWAVEYLTLSRVLKLDSRPSGVGHGRGRGHRR
ncbi:unnamed protein product [Boreogadus saida]